MANEQVWATLSQASLQTSGASAASNATVSGGTLATSMHSNYLWVDLVLTGTMAASIASASNYFAAHARHLDIDGTADAPTPGSSMKGQYVGNISFQGSGASGGQTGILVGVETSPLGPVEFYIENLTNATLNAGWTLKATPRTIKPQ